MALNNKEANSNIDIEQFSTGVNDVLGKVQNPTIALTKPGQELQKRVGLLKEMVNNLNKPILKALATDMLTVMSSWLNDPQVLCCLIQGIYAAYVAKNTKLTDGNQLKLADTNFGKFLDTMIAFIDFIIIFLTEDLKLKIPSFFIPDFIKEIMSTLMGAILLILQETSFAIRDSVISMIFEWMDTWDTEQTWSKCLPLKQMINILKKYVNDYGILADIFEKIKGYVGGMRVGVELALEKITPNVKDLEFLYWLRDLLIKLKKAVLNFDFCVDYTFFNNSINGVPGEEKLIRTVLGQTPNIENVFDPTLNINNPNDIQNYTIGADGTILLNKESNSNWIPRVSNTFLREFINKEYGIPYEVIENTITRGSSADHVQGTDITSDNQYLIDKCVNTPTAQETLRWILNIKSR